MNREKKEAQVARLKKIFAQARLVVVTHYSGLNVPEMNELRRSMREAGAEFNVTKNRLTKLALEGSPYGARASSDRPRSSSPRTEAACGATTTTHWPGGRS